MKALAVFPGHHKIELVDHPAPDGLGAKEVRLRILEVGICGTDREIATFEYGRPPAGYEYLILGHESLAQVIEAGSAVTDVKPGDLVVPEVRRACPEMCEACAAGRQDFCMTGHYRERGIVTEHGFITEFIKDDETRLHLVPRRLADLGVLAEPLTVTEKAFDQICAIQRRRPWLTHGGSAALAVVLGAGPVGLLAAMKFRAEGYEVWVYSRGSEKEKPPIVAEIGARFIDAESVSPPELLDAANNGIEIVFEAAGASDVAFEILEQLGRNGIYVFTGIPRRNHIIPLDASTLLYNLVLKNQVVLGTVNAAPAHFDAAITDLARFLELFPSAISRLITSRHPIEEFRQPLFHPTGIKSVISMSQISS